MKYTLEEIKEYLLNPSFDIQRYMGEGYDAGEIIDVIKEAIEYHEQLSNDNNAEHQ
jgi:hypothetical protein